MDLTPEQRHAIRMVHKTLAREQDSTENDAFWRGALRLQLAQVAEAFPEDAS